MTNGKTLKILAAVLLLSIFSVKGFAGYLDNSHNRFYPAISDKYIVWEDDRRGNIDIYYCYLTDPYKEFLITKSTDNELLPAPGDQISPAIYRDTVVWMEKKIPESIWSIKSWMGTSDWDIYGYRISTGEKISITTSKGDQVSPAIYGDIIVWQDNRNGNWDIYGYDLDTKQEFQITTNLGDQCSPTIYAGFVVWEDHRYGNWDIYMYNVLTAQEFQITKDPYSQQFPAVYKAPEPQKLVVVWMDKRNFNWDIYGYNLPLEKSAIGDHNEHSEESPAPVHDELSGVEFPIVTNQNNQRSPVVYGDHVVYYDNRNGNWDIFVYDLSSSEGSHERAILEGQEEFPKTVLEERYPAVYEDHIVWMYTKKSEDTESCTGSCNWCMYLYNITKEEGYPITTPECTSFSWLTKYYHFFVCVGVACAAISITLLVYKTAKEYPHLTVEYESRSGTYEINVCKDPLSNYLLGKPIAFFFILFLFFVSLLLTGFIHETLKEIDINSIPREKVVFLMEEAISRANNMDPRFFLAFLVPLFIFYFVKRLFSYIPEVFDRLFEDGIITKGKKSTDQVLSDLEKSLKNFENLINGKIMYMVGIGFSVAAFIDYFLDIPRKSVFLVHWNDFDFFPLNSTAYAVVVLIIFFTFGLFIWKMICIVGFMWQLNRKYDLVLKPYDTDGSGGFGPLEELWLRMSFVGIAVFAIPLFLLFLNQFFGTFFNPVSISGFCSIPVVVLLVILVWNYHHIIETGKTNYLDSIEEKIEIPQERIDKYLFKEKKGDLDDNCITQIEQLQKIKSEVDSIHSLPFKQYQKIYLSLSIILPWIPKIIEYFT